MAHIQGENAQLAIVFFDGDCGLCQRSVRCLLTLDRRHRLHFAPLQGETARQYLSAAQTEDLSSMVFWHQGQSEERSQAIMKVLRHISPWWVWTAVFYAVPLAWRDGLYNKIVHNRKKWFDGAICSVNFGKYKGRFLL